jgi:hypothetical protein
MLNTRLTRQDEHDILLFQVGCEKIIIETDNVAKGLEELVTLHNVTELVMGAAADRHFSKYGSATKSSVSPRKFSKIGSTNKMTMHLTSTNLNASSYS